MGRKSCSVLVPLVLFSLVAPEETLAQRPLPAPPRPAPAPTRPGVAPREFLRLEDFLRTLPMSRQFPVLSAPPPSPFLPEDADLFPPQPPEDAAAPQSQVPEEADALKTQQESIEIKPGIWRTDHLSILYGVTFNLTNQDPYVLKVEEAYQFVEAEGTSELRVVGYCIQETAVAGYPCSLQEFQGGEVRLDYEARLEPNQFATHGYLYEEFVLSTKPIWVVIADAQRKYVFRPLNYFQNLKDPFGNPQNSRMTTIHLPINTFVALDQSEREESLAMDIAHYPRQFFNESLNPRTVVITRVNPKIPPWLRWFVRQYLSLGIENIVFQWLSLSVSALAPLTIIGWFGNRIIRKNRQRRAGFR